MVAIEEDSVSDKMQSANGSGDEQSFDKNQDMYLVGDHCLLGEQDKHVFKTPQKRRMKQCHYSKPKRMGAPAPFKGGASIS